MSYGFYIYYRVAAENSEVLRRRIAAMQDAVAESTGVRGRLLTKADEPLLWMEIYEGIAETEAFRASLANAWREAAAGDLLPIAARKTEIFRAG